MSNSPYYPKMWFGTFSHMQWIDCPLRGVDMSPSGWGSDGTYLSGGGYAFGSPDSHRDYIFEWRGTSSVEDAQIVHSYRNGVYSDTPHDLIYFQDPNNLRRNLLPARWANPSMNLGSSGFASSLVKDQAPFGVVEPVVTPAGRVAEGLPRRGVKVLESRYTTANPPDRPGRGAIFVPVQPSTRGVNAIRFLVNGSGFSSGNGVYGRAVLTDGTLHTPTQLTSIFASDWAYKDNDRFSQQAGMLLYCVGSGFELYGMTALYRQLDGEEIYPVGTSVTKYPWAPGTGNSGCSFVGNPTFVNTSGVDDGQVSYAATLKETGDWLL